MTGEIAWSKRLTVGRLSALGVHVWVVGLDVSPSRLHSLAMFLSSEERERAARFRGAVLSHRFIAARGYLREVLGEYLATEPSSVRFAYETDGKPLLATSRARPLLQFNVSHSNGLALIAVSRDARVGVDIEEVAPFDDMARVADRFFSPLEREQLAAVPSPDFVLAFYCCWTRKEAYLKALGTGLRTPLDSFDVAVAPTATPTVRHGAGGADATEDWSVVQLCPADGFVGALVVQLSNPEVSCCWWAR